MLHRVGKAFNANPIIRRTTSNSTKPHQLAKEVPQNELTTYKPLGLTSTKDDVDFLKARNTRSRQLRIQWIKPPHPQRPRGKTVDAGEAQRGAGVEGSGRALESIGRSALKNWGAPLGLDKRGRNTQLQEDAKRRKLEGLEDDLPVYATRFTEEEIKAEERKPKKKVAVMIGYSGTGYKGMQLNEHGKTIEGDLFLAFVAAGAISKANADDPKKSALVRCARTDKGVHAAGNVISLKLIIEDPDIVAKINEKLVPQIRVWGIEQVNGGFSAYQLCDSRIYEYLIPTHCFIPPHPQSFLGKKLLELAEEADDLEGYNARQQDASNFWPETEKNHIRSFLGSSEPELVDQILTSFYENNAPPDTSDDELLTKLERFATKIIHEPANKFVQKAMEAAWNEKHPEPSEKPQEISPTEILIHRLKYLNLQAKKAYRISPERLARVKSTLQQYVGSHHFHNYTIDKTMGERSARRNIKSFEVAATPIVIGNTEWLSLKVHGQSFMMNQIRKMVSMAALIVRCGCPEDRIKDSYFTERLLIPKAPGLGLLLERPVFDEYNKRLLELKRGIIDFKPYAKELEQFKQREIYEQIFRVEERENLFHVFFQTLDSTRSARMLFLSSVGVEAVERNVGIVGQDLDEGVGGDGDGEEGGGKGVKMREEADATVEAEMEEEWGDRPRPETTAGGKAQTVGDDAGDVSSEDEKGGHDEG